MTRRPAEDPQPLFSDEGCGVLALAILAAVVGLAILSIWYPF